MGILTAVCLLPAAPSTPLVAPVEAGFRLLELAGVLPEAALLLPFTAAAEPGAGGEVDPALYAACCFDFAAAA